MACVGVCPQFRSSQVFIESGDLPKFGAEDVHDAITTGSVLLNMHTEGDSEQSTLEVTPRVVRFFLSAIRLFCLWTPDVRSQLPCASSSVPPTLPSTLPATALLAVCAVCDGVACTCRHTACRRR